MNIGIIVVVLSLVFGIATTQDIELSENKASGFTISHEELLEMEESMEPELFEGVLHYYEVEQDGEEEVYEYDTSSEPQDELYAVQGVNVRSKPGIHGKVLGTLSSGDKAGVYGENDEWLYIRHDETEGFVSKKYLSEKKPEIKTKKTVTVKNTDSSQSAVKKGRISESVMEEGEYATEMTFNLSFYSNIPRHNGGYSKTASGKTLAYGMAANNVLPIGTKIYLEGWGVVTIEDRGGSGFNTVNRLDLFIPPKEGETESQYIARLRQLGRQTAKGTILN